MFCKNCGTEMQGNVCPNCGYQEPQAQAEDVNASEASAPGVAAPEVASTPEVPAPDAASNADSANATAPNADNANATAPNAAQPAQPNTPPQGQPGFTPPAGQPCAQPYTPPAGQAYAYGQPAPGCAPYNAPAADDKKSVGLNVLSFFFPVIGLIIYLTTKKDKPVRAKSMGKSALGGFITWFVLSVILSILLVALGMYGMSVLQDEASGSYETPYITAQDGWHHAYGNRYADTIFQSNSMTVVFDGVEVQFPCTYAEFTQKTGYVLEDTADVSQPLNVKNISEYVRAYNAVGSEVYIHFYNNGDAPAPAGECLVAGITVDIWNSSTSVVLPQNIQLGGAYQAEELTEKYGEPDFVYTGNTAFVYMLWEESPYGSNIKISSGDGLRITEIDFDICLAA